MCDAWLCQNALIFHGPKIITSMHPMAGTIDHIAAEQRRWQTLLHLIHQGNHPQNPKNITYCKLRVLSCCFDPNSDLGTTEKHGFHGILELFSIMKSTMDFEAKKNRQISLKSSAFETTLSAHHRTNSSKAIDLHLLTWQLQQLTAFVVLTIGICSAREGNVEQILLLLTVVVCLTRFACRSTGIFDIYNSQCWTSTSSCTEGITYPYGP